MIKIESKMSFLLKKETSERKNAQVTIFILIGLIIVTILAIFFLLKFNSGPVVKLLDENNPQGFIETCARGAVEDAINRIDIHGGDIVPKEGANYQNEKRIYICKTDIYYKPCIYRKPLLVENIEKQITDYSKPIIADCFDKLRQRLKNRYPSIKESPNLKVTTRLFPRQVSIKIEKDFRLTRESETISFDNFNIRIAHPIYNFAKIAMEIANQQAKYCYFDNLGFMITNPDFDINETMNGNSDKFYVLRERATKQNFTFAIKSCPLPPGY